MMLNYDDAEAVGREVFDRWGSVAGKIEPPMPRDSMAWSDLVQLVLRKAGEIAAAREAAERPEPTEWR